jgi:hypothetical protein
MGQFFRGGNTQAPIDERGQYLATLKQTERAKAKKVKHKIVFENGQAVVT